MIGEVGRDAARRSTGKGSRSIGAAEQCPFKASKSDDEGEGRRGGSSRWRGVTWRLWDTLL
jgi:hypothetical protein